MNEAEVAAQFHIYFLFLKHYSVIQTWNNAFVNYFYDDTIQQTIKYSGYLKVEFLTIEDLSIL